MALKPHLEKLFQDAKAKDEFEFVCTLINFKGMGSRFSGSNHFEWVNAITFYEKQYRNAGYSVHEKARFALMIYATFFESSELYTILGNLARVVMGYRATPYLYWKHQKANRWFGTAEKISMLEEVLIDSGFEDIQKFFPENHFEQIRHAFFHSTYAFEDDAYIMHDVETLYINNLGYPSLSLKDFIFPRIETILEFFHAFEELYQSHIKSYTVNKAVKGRMPDVIDILILGSADGLKGFVDTRGSSIELKDDMWWAMNIRFGHVSEVDRHVGEELQRLIKKDKISTNDGALQRLYEVIVERNIQAEKEDLGTVYGRFGDMFMTKAGKETNHFKQRSLYTVALSFFDKMSELNSNYPFHTNKALAKYMVAGENGDEKLYKDAVNDLLQSLKTDVKKNVLNNVNVMLKEFFEKGFDIKAEKKAFEAILTGTIPPELAEEAEKIRKEIGNLWGYSGHFNP